MCDLDVKWFYPKFVQIVVLFTHSLFLTVAKKIEKQKLRLCEKLLFLVCITHYREKE